MNPLSFFTTLDSFDSIKSCPYPDPNEISTGLVFETIPEILLEEGCPSCVIVYVTFLELGVEM